MTVIPVEAGAANVYKLMVGAIVPRPIAFVSSLSAAGVRNLAPFSFFTAASANPPVVCFAPMVRGSDGLQKDTLHNVRETGEFVINIVSEDFVQKMNICSAEYPPEVDEWVESGLTPVASSKVKPPRVAESRFQMECKVMEIVSVSSKPLGGNLVLGKYCYSMSQMISLTIIESTRTRYEQSAGWVGRPTPVQPTGLTCGGPTVDCADAPIRRKDREPARARS